MLQAYGLFHYSPDDFQHTLIGVLVTRNSRMWLQFIDQDCFPSDIPLRLAEKNWFLLLGFVFGSSPGSEHRDIPILHQSVQNCHCL